MAQLRAREMGLLRRRHYGVLPLITVASLRGGRGGRCRLVDGARSARRSDVPTDGGRPRQRARFMAVLGLASCALFALQILAGAIPHWVLDACQ